ncbi:LOW QUALITY PROTEIN: hypothetical protein HJC23_008743 [Cyclotella cryptica]|uniref:Myotubularin phosphatase domain-containing protein n=1 Tax=Cyclotella cryptica TaxID=29204 RepID=A0ABD3PC66_9STRA
MLRGLKDVLGIYDDDDLENAMGQEGMAGSIATVCCCVMTFYRVAVFSYRATVSDGKVLFNDENRSRWIQSQNVSLQFQVAHDLADQRQKQYQHVITSSANSNNIKAITASSGPLVIILHGKDGGRWIKFTANSYSDPMRAHEALNTYAFPGRRNLEYLFQFESRRLSSTRDDGQSATLLARRFVPLEESERQGIFSPRGNDSNKLAYLWAILNANANYALCAVCHLFALAVLLMTISCQTLSYVDMLRFVRNAVFPLLLGEVLPTEESLGNYHNQLQPKVGLTEIIVSRMRYTYAIVEDGITKPPKDSSLLLKIVDMRLKSAAQPDTRLRIREHQFISSNVNMEHSYSSRCLHNINGLCISPNTTGREQKLAIHDPSYEIAHPGRQHTMYITTVFQFALISHGWARTSPVAALTQLMLVPRYRPIKRFSTLVEKDFMSFGHPFRIRCDHGQGKKM